MDDVLYQILKMSKLLKQCSIHNRTPSN